jgi:hypothetical protein
VNTHPGPRESGAGGQFLISEISSASIRRRIPDEYLGIDVNFCKTSGCTNFGVPPSRVSRRGRPTATADKPKDTYRLSGTGDIVYFAPNV